MSKDYYNILGVDKKASKDEIKKAFREKAQQFHPDKQGGDEAKFKEANEAYQVLGDEKKRAEYDTYGQTFSGAGSQGGFGGQGFGGFDPGSWSGAGFSGFQNAQGFEDIDLGDIFSQFGFGGFSGGGGQKRGRDMSTEITISFREAVFGTTRKILITKNSTCTTCNGTGAKEGSAMKTCAQCNGQGKIRDTKRTILGQVSTVRTCETCHGKGEVPEETCETCRGAGIVRAEQEIEINIPSGINDGEMVRMTGHGEAVRGGQTGDLYIKINVTPDEAFTRKGNDLVMDLDVKLTDAMLGATYNATLLDGETIDIKIPTGLKSGEVLKVKGKGIPGGRFSRGNLLIKTNILLPSKLSKEQKKIIEQLKEEGI